MELKEEHVYQWYWDNIKLVQTVCWKAKYRSDCGRSITFDDLMAHCLDKIVTVFGNFKPDKGAKLSTFVMLSLRFECMKYINKRNKIGKRFSPLYEARRHVLHKEWEENQDVKYIEEVELSDQIFIELEKILSPIQLRIYLLRTEDMLFDDIAKNVELKLGNVKKIYWEAFYIARKHINKKYLDDYT